jgi:prepilin-type N-terminal cleavage/methylation domain-containing protein
MKSSAAFTMIEILIVIVLVGIMAGVAVMAITTSQDDVQEAADLKNTGILQTQVEAYRAKRGAYPSTLDELLTTDPPYVRDIPGGAGAWNYSSVTGDVSKN